MGEITNQNPLGAFSSTHETTAMLEFPPTEGAEDYAGQFAWFTLPALEVGLGPQTHDVTATLHLTNKTRMAWFGLAMIMSEDKGTPLNIRADPVVSLAGVDPMTYLLQLDKQIQCISTMQTNAVGSNLTGVLDPIEMKCDYHGAPAPRPKIECDVSSDCRSQMQQLSTPGDTDCGITLALHAAALDKCSNDILVLYEVTSCFCQGQIDAFV